MKAILLLTMFTLLSCKARPDDSDTTAVIGEDDRIRTYTTNSIWSPVGLLVSTLPNEDKFACTATLIGPTTILTAAHCILRDSKMEFLVNYDYQTDDSQDSRKVKEVLARGMEVDVRFAADERRWRKNKDKDWALLSLRSHFLSKDLGNKYGYFTMSNVGANDSLEKIITVGYPHDKAMNGKAVRTVNHKYCQIIAPFPRVQAVVRHDCDTAQNHSGGPFLLADANGEFTRIIAIHSGGFHSSLPQDVSQDRLNYAVTVFAPKSLLINPQ